MAATTPRRRALRVNPDIAQSVRILAGFSVSGLAQEIETTPGHISNIEAGRRGLSPELAAAWAKACRVPVAALYASETPEEPAA